MLGTKCQVTQVSVDAAAVPLQQHADALAESNPLSEVPPDRGWQTSLFSHLFTCGDDQAVRKNNYFPDLLE